MSENGEIHTAGKNFTLPPAVTAWTNSTSDLWWRGRQPGALIVLVSLLQVIHRAVPPQIGLLASPDKVLGSSIENSVGISSRKAACAWGTQRIGVCLMSCPLLAVVVLGLLQLVSGHDRA